MTMLKIVSRVSLKIFVFPSSEYGSPLIVAAKRGCTLVSTYSGMLEMKGIPMFMSRTVCVVSKGLSTKSMPPFSMTMLLTENLGGSFFSSFGSSFFSSSSRSEKL